MKFRVSTSGDMEGGGMSESSLKNTWWSSWFILELVSFLTVSGVGVGAFDELGC